jgi:hypothetical protein
MRAGGPQGEIEWPDFGDDFRHYRINALEVRDRFAVLRRR